MLKGKCYGGKVDGKSGQWQICSDCGGRIHDKTCTAKITPLDCSPKRHEKMSLPEETAQDRQP